MSKTVIVGGVAAGAGCAARLRRLDESGEIVLFERGKHISYANCGLPYHIGNVIRAGSSLLVQTPEIMSSRYRVDVRTEQEVLSVCREQKTVTVKNLVSGEIYEESYDKLLLATGSSPVMPPLPGIEREGIFKLWTVEDALDIRKRMKKTELRKAVVVGGGFIGLEVAENLRAAEFEVSLVEMQDQVFPPFDHEMAIILQNQMKEKGISLFLSEAVESFSGTDERIKVHLKSGQTLECGLVVISAGTRANNKLAREAGLELNPRGGIKVNEFLQTSDPDIFAVGDVIVNDFSSERPLTPLAGPANKQGRLVADVIAGRKHSYEANRCPSIVKMFDYTAAVCGLNEKQLAQMGLIKGQDYDSVLITQNDHAAYYPGAVPMFFKLLYSVNGKTIYGAQIFGKSGVDKRIDDIGMAMKLHASIGDLQEVDLAYAPPYSSAKDPVNMAGFAAQNQIDGLISFADWDEVEKNPKAVLLDIREKPEIRISPLAGALQIPFGELRSRLNELDKAKTYIVFCTIGVRSYTAARALTQLGFENVKVYPGGTLFYHSIHVPEKQD